MLGSRIADRGLRRAYKDCGPRAVHEADPAHGSLFQRRGVSRGACVRRIQRWRVPLMSLGFCDRNLYHENRNCGRSSKPFPARFRVD